MTIIRRVPWTRQPPAGTRPNLGWLSAELRFLVSGTSPVNLIPGTYATVPIVNGTSYTEPGSNGLGLLANANADWLQYNNSGAVNRRHAPFTFLAIVRKKTAYTASGTWVHTLSAPPGGSPSIGLSGAFTDNLAMASGFQSGYWLGVGELASTAAGNVSVYVGTWDGASDTQTGRLYKNGVLQGSYTDPNGSALNIEYIALNNRGAFTTSYYNANPVSLFALWHRELSAAEVAAVSANPWQLFAPRTIPIPLAAAGGGGLPTLSNARATSITTTTAVPVVDYAY